MIKPELITTLVNQKIENSEIFLVSVEIKPTNKIFIEVDKNPAVTIQECVEISRFVERNLLENPDLEFELNVSSPGLDKPLKLIKQYQKNINRTLKVIYQNGNNITGTLTQATNQHIELTSTTKQKVEGKKKKVEVTQTHQIPYQDIKEAKIVIKF